jgi:hypothetical protein
LGLAQQERSREEACDAMLGSSSNASSMLPG